MRHLTNHRPFPGTFPLAVLSAVLILAFGCSKPAPTTQDVPAQTQTPSPEAKSPGAGDTGEARLGIAGIVPLAGEPLDDRIVFFFDDPVKMAPDAESPEPFTIEPEVKGDFRVDQNFAAFQANEPFSEDTVYTVELSPDLISETGATIPEAARQHRFASFAFQPRRMWEIEEEAGRLVLGLLFPAAVDAEALGEHLVVENLDGESVDYEIEAGDEGVMRVVFPEGIEGPIRLKVLKGLADASGTAELAKERLFVYPQDPFFAVVSVQWGHFEGPEREIVIECSKEVPAQSIADSLSVTRTDNGAAVPFKLISRGDATEHRIQLELPATEYPPIRVHLAKGMQASHGRSLVKDFAITLETRPEPLEVTRVRWGSTDGDDHTLFVQFSHSVRTSALASRAKLVETATGKELEFDIRGGELAQNAAFVFTPEHRAELKVVLTIAEGLPGVPNAVLLEPYRREMARPAPPLQIEDTWWMSY